MHRAYRRTRTRRVHRVNSEQELLRLHMRSAIWRYHSASPQVLAGSGAEPKCFPHELTRCRNMTKHEPSQQHTCSTIACDQQATAPHVLMGFRWASRALPKCSPHEREGFRHMTQTTSYQQHHQTAMTRRNVITSCHPNHLHRKTNFAMPSRKETLGRLISTLKLLPGRDLNPQTISNPYLIKKPELPLAQQNRLPPHSLKDFMKTNGSQTPAVALECSRQVSPRKSNMMSLVPSKSIQEPSKELEKQL